MSKKLSPEMTAWVTRLREFYTGLDMTYVELVETLGGDPSTLSRYFNGERLPEIKFLGRLYEAVETKTQSPVRATVKESVRELYFAACRVHEPHHHEVYVLREEIEDANSRAEQAQETIWDLQMRLTAEQARRVAAEAALRQLETQTSRDVSAALQQRRDALAERDRVNELVARLSKELAESVRTRYLIARQHGELVLALARAEQTLEEEIERRWTPRDESKPVRSAKPLRWWRWGARRRELIQLHQAAYRVTYELPRLLEEAAKSGSVENIAIESLGIRAGGHIGEVAAAFEDIQRQTVRLAAEQALLRGNVNAMVTNLSRRSQDLIQRQISIISELESREFDPDQLSSLFKLDHLVTRMRRNGENLLVLAGEDPFRNWTRPVPLIDVLRAAASEVEQYERIELVSVSTTEVAGRVVNDLVQLLAELLENATSFSSPQTKVKVTGHALPDGRVLIEIHDTGIGLSPEDLAAINERLASPPTLDVSVSLRMGLLVVARLSQRHAIRIQLQRPDSAATTALVVLPADTLVATTPDQEEQGA
ncbi:ATP-binding protein [Streptomyces sp. NPDC087856]|uniref:ATP-binding protein n=1 Tax=Streptomyces sp. NPDC087856 TaxID=3365811 RepID=UPI0038156034